MVHWTRGIGGALLLAGTYGVGAAEAQVPLHGIAFSKGCLSPRDIGDPYLCGFKVENLLTSDTAGDTLTFTSIVDVVHAGTGDVSSGNILSVLPILSQSGGATCNPTQTLCTLPSGAAIIFALFSQHIVAATDPNPLTDTASLTWQDLCTSGVNNCPLQALLSTTASQATIATLPPPPPPPAVPTLSHGVFLLLTVLIGGMAARGLRRRPAP